MADMRSLMLTEVRHVPSLRKFLIFIGMLDSKKCSFEASRGTLRVSKKNKEMLCGGKIRGIYRLEGSVQTGRATIRHGSSGASKQNKQGKQQLHIRRYFEIYMEVWPNPSGATSAECLERSLDEGDKVDFEELYSDGCSAAEMSLFCS
ncbi:hypothetical protein Acr_04g0010980 [Actinidia rufa]|uniref:Uncharacterized protein n=1 Tax=Actinidia rufa TaxID=165716 RepID=A0A7J0EIZ4_9ERIC|nr:hypothetical protein Acr_04g0010980 [Actinidia rufa]